MARKPIDLPAFDGSTERRSVTLDAGSSLFLEYLGGGRLSVGIREAARMARDASAAAGTLPRGYLDEWKQTHPDEVAAYYAAHPEQLETPYRPKYAGVVNPRTTKGSAAPAAPAPVPYVVLPPPTVYPLEVQQAMDDAERARLAAPAVTPGFEGWDE